jgi:hypothetical protein
MRILIATGIYPPKTSGPAQYAKNMEDCWEKMGHKVAVKTYHFEHKLPSGVRHLYYFLKIIPSVIFADFIFALDTLSVGWPATLAAKLFGKKIILRTGGDFLWEGYVERTGNLVLLRNFYTRGRDTWSDKEKKIFKITKWVLHSVDLLVFSTAWQRDIWMEPYQLGEREIRIVENRYGEKEASDTPTALNFVSGTRPLKWKNIPVLQKSFAHPEVKEAKAVLDEETLPYGEFMKKMSKAYAVILASLGDISPHMVLDAIRLNKPFIITKENGLMDRIAPVAITVDPENPEDIKEKVLWLCDKNNYDSQVKKLREFTFTHSWDQIANEILELYKKI